MAPIFREEDGKTIRGESLPVCVLDSKGRYVLDQIEVYKDGAIYCNSLSPLTRDISEDRYLSLEDFKKIIAQDHIVTSIPRGAHLYQLGFAVFKIEHMQSRFETKEDYILAIQDILHELNGEYTSSYYCSQAFYNFLNNPTQDNQEKLRLTYNAVPSPYREAILGDYVNGDANITAILARDFSAIDEGWLQELKVYYSEEGLLIQFDR